MNQSLEIDSSTSLVRNRLLEIVTIKANGNRCLLAVLSRQNIIDALAGNITGVDSIPWENVELDERNLTNLWRANGMDAKKNQNLIADWLAESTVRKQYSLDELGVKNPQELLEKYFKKNRRWKILGGSKKIFGKETGYEIQILWRQ